MRPHSAVPIQSSGWRKIRTFIYNKKHIYKLEMLKFIREYLLYEKLKTLIGYLIDILVTGTLIYIALHGQYLILRYGIGALLITYYVQKLIQEIKK
jgi:hypothetical protein